MYANFTEETCTGTAATLALAGATSGNIAFSESFADGDLVVYVVKDSGGTIKVAGVGAYVSTTDDITRNDTWNWNGTVIDDNPSTNITLSGGTHTVRCDSVDTILAPPEMPTDVMVNQAFICGTCANYPNSFGGIVTGTIYYVPFYHPYKRSYTKFGTEIITAATGNTRIGIYTSGSDGLPDNLVIESAELDSSTTGFKEETIALTLKAGSYWSAVQVSSSSISPSCGDPSATAMCRVGSSVNDPTTTAALYGATQTYGAFPSSPPTPTASPSVIRQPLVYLEA